MVRDHRKKDCKQSRLRCRKCMKTFVQHKPAVISGLCFEKCPFLRNCLFLRCRGSNCAILDSSTFSHDKHSERNHRVKSIDKINEKKMKNLGQNLGHNTMDRHAHRYAFFEHEGRPHITAIEEKNRKME